MASRRKSKPTPLKDEYVPEDTILMEADRVLGSVRAALPGLHGVVQHESRRVSRKPMAVIFVSASAYCAPITGLTVRLRHLKGPAYGVLEGNRHLWCGDLEQAIQQVADRVEANRQMPLPF